MFRNAQTRWSTSCKEGYALVQAVVRFRHLLEGNLPFAFITDHAALMYVFGKSALTSTVGKASRDRLHRWATFLRSHVYEVHHIPGAQNHMCDLLSRNGCNTMTKSLAYERKAKAERMCPGDKQTAKDVATRPQHAIIRPQVLDGPFEARNGDMDMTHKSLLPSPEDMQWPDAQRIALAQQSIMAPGNNTRMIKGVTMKTTSSDKLLLPRPPADIIDEIIAIAHQGDQYHRSSVDTVILTLRRFAFEGLTYEASRLYIVSRCQACLSCIKMRTGDTIPRPMWYMIRATRPFELLHMDYVSMPETTTGMKHLLVVTDDLSCLVVLEPTTTNDAATVALTLLSRWLAHYPDPAMIHTDGGSHFDNQIMKMLAKRRGWDLSLSTPYAKWAHGIAERMNKSVLSVMRPLCRALKVPINKWDTVAKLVQGILNRMSRKSRGGRSPMELTTGIPARNSLDAYLDSNMDVTTVDTPTSEIVNKYVKKLANIITQHWDMADTARRASSQRNAKRMDKFVIPRIDIGDFILYAEYIEGTKLDYKWQGPGRVIAIINTLIYQVQSLSQSKPKPFPVHCTRLRRYASKMLNVTVQLVDEINYDHPENVIAKVVKHTMQKGALWVQCRWRGLTAEKDTLQKAEVIAEDAPKALTDYYKLDGTTKDTHLELFIAEHFPTLKAEMRHEKTRKRRLGTNPTISSDKAKSNGATETDAIDESGGAVATKKKRGRPRKADDATTKTDAQTGSGNTEKTKKKRGRPRKKALAIESGESTASAPTTAPTQKPRKRGHPRKNAATSESSKKDKTIHAEKAGKKALPECEQHKSKTAQEKRPRRQSARLRANKQTEKAELNTHTSELAIMPQEKPLPHLRALIESAGRTVGYATLRFGGRHIVCLHDTGCQITQISTEIRQRLRRHNVPMTVIEDGRALWRTAAQRKPTEIILWHISSCAIVDPNSGRATPEIHLLVAEVGSLQPQTAYLGTSTMVAFRLSTNHAMMCMHNEKGETYALSNNAQEARSEAICLDKTTAAHTSVRNKEATSTFCRTNEHDGSTRRKKPRQNRAPSKGNTMSMQMSAQQTRKREMVNREAPICCLAECRKTCYRYPHGLYDAACSREHHQLWCKRNHGHTAAGKKQRGCNEKRQYDRHENMATTVKKRPHQPMSADNKNKKKKKSKQNAPTCCLAECTRTCHRYPHGNYALACTREHHQRWRRRQCDNTNSSKSQQWRNQMCMHGWCINEHTIQNERFNQGREATHKTKSKASRTASRSVKTAESADCAESTDWRKHSQTGRSERMTVISYDRPKAQHETTDQHYAGEPARDTQPRDPCPRTIHYFVYRTTRNHLGGLAGDHYPTTTALVKQVNKRGIFVPVIFDGVYIPCLHDTGCTLTQLSVTLIRMLRRKGADMLHIESPIITWTTATGEDTIKCKLWLIRKCALANVEANMSTALAPYMVIENPRLKEKDAILGLNTLITHNLVTIHERGEIATPGGVSIKLWESIHAMDACVQAHLNRFGNASSKDGVHGCERKTPASHKGEHIKHTIATLMNNVSLTKEKGNDTRWTYPHTGSVLQKVRKVGHLATVSFDGFCIVCMLDTGTSITQLSSQRIQQLQRQRVTMTMIEEPRVQWDTPTASYIIQVKLWLVQNCAIVDIKQEVSSQQKHVMIMENPKLRADAALLGRSTLITLGLSTDHETGIIYGPAGGTYCMWSSSTDIEARLTELYPDEPKAHSVQYETTHADGSSSTVSDSTDTSVPVEEMTPVRVGFCSPPRKEEYRRQSWTRLRRAVNVGRNNMRESGNITDRIAIAELRRVHVDPADTIPLSDSEEVATEMSPEARQTDDNSPTQASITALFDSTSDESSVVNNSKSTHAESSSDNSPETTATCEKADASTEARRKNQCRMRRPSGRSRKRYKAKRANGKLKSKLRTPASVTEIAEAFRDVRLEKRNQKSGNRKKKPSRAADDDTDSGGEARDKARNIRSSADHTYSNETRSNDNKAPNTSALFSSSSQEQPTRKNKQLEAQHGNAKHAVSDEENTSFTWRNTQDNIENSTHHTYSNDTCNDDNGTPNVAALFTSSSEEQEQHDYASRSIVIPSKPLQISDIPDTWPTLKAEGKGWIPRREVMRQRRQTAQQRRAKQQSRVNDEIARPKSPPNNLRNRDDVMNEDVVILTESGKALSMTKNNSKAKSSNATGDKTFMAKKPTGTKKAKTQTRSTDKKLTKAKSGAKSKAKAKASNAAGDNILMAKKPTDTKKESTDKKLTKAITAVRKSTKQINKSKSKTKKIVKTNKSCNAKQTNSKTENADHETRKTKKPKPGDRKKAATHPKKTTNHTRTEAKWLTRKEVSVTHARKSGTLPMQNSQSTAKANTVGRALAEFIAKNETEMQANQSDSELETYVRTQRTAEDASKSTQKDKAGNAVNASEAFKSGADSMTSAPEAAKEKRKNITNASETYRSRTAEVARKSKIQKDETENPANTFEAVESKTDDMTSESEAAKGKKENIASAAATFTNKSQGPSV